MKMGKVVIAVLLGFVQGIVKRTANLMWADIWEKLFAAIAEAEARFLGDGGQLKKQWVMETVEGWLKEKVQLNFIQDLLFKMLLSRVVDAIIAELNATMGHDWILKAQEVERQFAGWIPLID